jgi:hypothetical protein
MGIPQSRDMALNGTTNEQCFRESSGSPIRLRRLESLAGEMRGFLVSSFVAGLIVQPGLDLAVRSIHRWLDSSDYGLIQATGSHANVAEISAFVEFRSFQLNTSCVPGDLEWPLVTCFTHRRFFMSLREFTVYFEAIAVS